MKTIIRILIMLSTLHITTIAKAQQNLVPNPSFEEFNRCPQYTDDRFAWKFWTSFGGTPDVFTVNACEDSSVRGGVPQNFAGHQMPASGNSYAGLMIDCPNFNSWHEYLAVRLIDSLTIGVKYYISAKVSLAEYSSCASNNFGIGLVMDSFNNTYLYFHDDSLPSYLKINSQTIIADSVNWTTISGSFTADSAYKYLVISNFIGYHSTDTTTLISFDSCIANINISCIYETAYYYVDDVCVTTDSSGCDFSTGIKSNPLSSFKVYPNPASDKIFITTNEHENIEYSLISLLGEKIKAVKSEAYIDISDIPNGVYLLEIKCSNQTFYKKQSIIH